MISIAVYGSPMAIAPPEKRRWPIKGVDALSRKLFYPVSCDIDAPGDPNRVVGQHMVKNRARPQRAGTSNKSTMKSDTHHFGCDFSLAIEQTNPSLRYVKNWSPLLKPWGVAKRISFASSVYGTMRWATIVMRVVRELVRIGVCVIYKSPFLYAETTGVSPVRLAKPNGRSPKIRLCASMACSMCSRSTASGTCW